MKLIHPKFEIIPQDSTLDGIYKHIELCGRVAYKSEDRITENSARKFVEKLIAMKHLSPLEHGTVYLKKPIIMHVSDDTDSQAGGWEEKESYDDKYDNNPYSYVILKKNPRQLRPIYSSYTLGYVYITTNLRVLVENGWMDDLKYLCKPTKYHEKRTTVRLILDRAIAMEFLRHRKFSFTMESTR